MRRVLIYVLLIVLLDGCKKEPVFYGSRVDIYLLKSFTYSIDSSTSPATNVITGAVLEDAPLVANQSIVFYTQSTATFTLRNDVWPIIRNFGTDKAFAVTVDDQPIYYGVFHPAYLSSITFGLAIIIPELAIGRELQIDFPSIDGNSFLQQLDKRNDSRIINALRATSRLHY